MVFGKDTRVVAGPDQLNSTQAKRNFQKAIDDFKALPSLGTAADAMRFAGGKQYWQELKQVAEYLNSSHAGRLPEGLMSRAVRVLSKDSEYPPRVPVDNISSLEQLSQVRRQRIQALRRSLTEYPRNALGWMDLARLKTSVGDNEAAERHIRTSIALAPNSRVVVRSTARFFAHVGDLERARRVLQAAPRTQSDPWLLASEIAIGSVLGKASRFVRRGHQLLESRQFAPADTAELAGALAVEELANGMNRKKVRRLYLASLIAPNDNVLAQAQWAPEDLELEEKIRPEWLENPASAEAALYRAIRTGDVDLGLKKALLWHIDEPFASRPMVAASYLASINGDFRSAEKFAQAGLIVEPESLGLLNNLIFILLVLGQPQRAIKALWRAHRVEGGRADPHTIANVGLMAYAAGQPEMGNRAYLEAIRRFEKSGQHSGAALAHIFHAFAARAIGADPTNALLHEASDVAKQARDPLVKRAAMTILKLDPVRVGMPLLPPESSRIRDWIYDQEKNNLILK